MIKIGKTTVEVGDLFFDVGTKQIVKLEGIAFENDPTETVMVFSGYETHRTGGLMLVPDKEFRGYVFDGFLVKLTKPDIKRLKEQCGPKFVFTDPGKDLEIEGKRGQKIVFKRSKGSDNSAEGSDDSSEAA